MGRPPDILTIDVEEWFHGHNYLEHVPPAQWDRQESRVEPNTELCLALLAEHQVKATFFVLGWTAARHPGLIERIAAAGHEIACHSFAHPVVFDLDEDGFRRDLDDARGALRDCGVPEPQGYRAPSFTLTPQVHRYLHILRETGFTYDCSIYPVHHPRYGQPAAPRRAFLVGGAPTGAESLLELPMTTARCLGLNLPFSGGGYLRLLPGWAYGMLRGMARRQGQPVIIYMHPWELDDLRPDVGLGRLSRLRSQGGQDTMREKLERLLVTGSFSTMGDYVARLRAAGDLPVREAPFC